MFKLIKRHGAHTNVPEYTKLKAEAGTSYDCGLLYHLVEGVAKISGTSSDKYFISETRLAAPANGDEEILGYFVTPDMIFETIIEGPISGVTTGMTLSAASIMNQAIDGVGAVEGSFAILLEKKADTTVTVQIVC